MVCLASDGLAWCFVLFLLIAEPFVAVYVLERFLAYSYFRVLLFRFFRKIYCVYLQRLGRFRYRFKQVLMRVNVTRLSRC